MYFQKFKSTANNQWYFNITADNNEKIAASEGYTSQAGRDNAIAAIKKDAANARVYNHETGKWE